MSKQITEHIKDFQQKIKAANKEFTKKEAFKDLLNRLYAGNDETRRVIDAISSGAETAIVNIPRKDKLHKGSADTLYNKIIIEFENNLKKTGTHAKEQLAGYLLGQFKSGEGYNYTLIASDFINWKVFAPDVSCLDKLEILKENELTLKEIESASFTLTENNAEDFYYWIDRFLFKEERQKATLKRIEEAFGYQSLVFRQCFREMTKSFHAIKESGEVQVSFEQWKKFLSIAYGTFDATENNFLIHTYLSVFAKMLAYTVVSNDEYIDDDEVREIINGSIFDRYNIYNFVENDFFHWIENEQTFPTLKNVFRLIAHELSAFDFQNVDEDILKGVYQELIDLDTRHALGEYYTPDWLCERIIDEFDFKTTDKILDPSCGSGSFLRAVIDRIRRLHPKIEVERLNDQIHGIDIHPLSVQIAKTTLLLALGREVVNAKKPIHLNIVLANTLLAPQGVALLYANIFQMEIDKQKYQLHTNIFDDAALFDEALNACENLAEQTRKGKVETIATFTTILKKQTGKADIGDEVVESFYEIYKGFKLVKEAGRDSIWKFIVQNLYKPYFLKDKFDYVVGNPPWFTFGSIRNKDYQQVLDALAKAYDVKPERIKNYPNLEIAAIFLAYCSSYFLRSKAKLAFVLPRSFFSADHHENTRSGKARGFRPVAAWDLESVTPLFRVPSCVLFVDKSNSWGGIPKSGLPGKTFSGKLLAHNCNWKTAAEKLTEEDVTWFYLKQGNSSALSQRNQTIKNRANPYKKLFRKGAELTPRSCYFVDINQQMPSDFEDRILNVRTSRLDAKKPWTNIDFKGKIESCLLFRTALSKSILPFALFNPNLVLLPITIEENKVGGKKIKVHSSDELRQEGILNGASWFRKAEDVWVERRTEKNKNISATEYLNWHNKLVEQDLNAPYLVLYNSSAQDANAVTVKRVDYDLEFIVDFVTYVFYSHFLNEAYYLSAILNSAAPNAMMKDFQARGLFGARHVHKKILDIYFPRFDAGNGVHSQIAALSEMAHQKVADFLRSKPPRHELTAAHLGRLRAEIKKYIEKELQEIDFLVQQIIA
jgi:type I restriction-modification system DNA methylase subunit